MRYITLFFFLFFTSSSLLSAQCNHPDYAALMAIYDALDGAHWTYNGGWEEGAAGTDCNVCDWDYVSCDNNDRVISFSSYSNGYKGIIPKEIGDLMFLERINLSYGEITNGIPEELYQLTNLKNLHLSDVELVGEISSSIGNLVNLENLYLDGNKLSGSIPESIGNCTKLKILFLGSNKFTGSVPATINNFTQIEWIELSRNKLGGPLPELTSEGFAGIHEFDVSYNDITGTIPSSYGGFNSLSYLGLSDNKLSGCVPNYLLKLCSNLVSFNNNTDLDGDSFSDFCSSGAGACWSLGNENNTLISMDIVNTVVEEYLYFTDRKDNSITIEVYDLQGIRTSVKGNRGDNYLDLGALHSGIYVVKMIDENGAYKTVKILKQ